MPRKTIEKTKLPPPTDESSESTVSSLESDFEEPKVVEKTILPTPAPAVAPVPTHPSGAPKKPRVRKTKNDEELKELKRANFAKAVEASAIVRAQKVEEARLKAEQEAKEKDELVRQAKEQAMKEVYERILLEQKQALKTELNKKMKTAPKKAAKATKAKQVMEEMMEEPEPVPEPVKKTIEKPKPAPKQAPVSNVIQHTPTQTVKLTQAQMLARFGF